jgi:lipopolysaccharide biosynthesis protein
MRRVVDRVRHDVRIEAASSPFMPGLDRYAVLVHYSPTAVVSRSVTSFVAELHRLGYFVVISSSCEAEGDLEWPDGRMPDRTIVIRKPNIGYDFGTAAVALAQFPDMESAPYVIIANDSNVGPFAPLDTVIRHFESSDADAWGVTGSFQYVFHLQSFFLGFRNGILADRPLRRFWRGIRHFDDKKKVIQRYELGLSALLTDEGYVLDSMYGNAEFGAHPARMTAIFLWKELLSVGYPFVKRSLATKTRQHASRTTVAGTVREAFHTELEEWL